MNNTHKHLDFKMTEEINNTPNYLDPQINRTHGKIQLGIYRKSTQTDTTIYFNSNNPLQHKLAAYIFYINRLLSTPITEKVKQYDCNTICTIAKNNGLPLQLIHNLKHKLTHTQHNTNIPTGTAKKTCTTCTYHSPLIHKFTNLFKNTNLHIAFRTNNTILHYLRHQSPHNKHNAIGIHKLQCTTCNKLYVGQTGRSIATRYLEHIRYIRNNNPLSRYATHISNNRHDYDKPELTLQSLQICEKGYIMDCWESQHIQLLKQQKLLIDAQRVNDLKPVYSVAHTTHHNTHNN
jgi:hypothetical protein